MSVHGESLSSVNPDKQRILGKNRRKKISDTYIKGDKKYSRTRQPKEKGKIG